MFKKIFLGLVALIAILGVVVAMQPPEFRISRSASIAAPASTVFAEVNDFHRWEGWSPWAKIDPAMKQTFEGAASGTGAVYTWAGNDQVGEGKMTILESRPGELVRIQLDFLKPFAASNTAEFTFKPDGDKTSVTWTMTGKKGFLCKAMQMCMNMDQMLGGEFDKGLAQMKSIAEAGKH